MKKISLFFLFAFLFLGFGCQKQAEKPKITLNDYTTQAQTAEGMVIKIMNETDYKRMHEIARAVESSRAISCVAVSDECNLLAKILNKIVSSTTGGFPKEADNVEIYKMIGELREEFREGRSKLSIQWDEYQKAHPEDSKKP